jgi:hypothetical protein
MSKMQKSTGGSSMIKVRPLGAISDFVVDELPGIIANQPEGLALRCEQLFEHADIPRNLSTNVYWSIALLDLKFIETALVFLGFAGEIPEKLKGFLRLFTPNGLAPVLF